MTDKELLKLAAIAVGIELGICPDGYSGFWGFDWNGARWTIYVHEDHPTIKMPPHCGKEFTYVKCNDGKAWEWTPLTDDGDALRLAVKCGIVIDTGDDCVHVQYVIKNVAKPITVHEYDDVYAATRRAIVMAAANIGQQLESA